jgi:hypothetical protein
MRCAGGPDNAEQTSAKQITNDGDAGRSVISPGVVF